MFKFLNFSVFTAKPSYNVAFKMFIYMFCFKFFFKFIKLYGKNKKQKTC